MEGCSLLNKEVQEERQDKRGCSWFILKSQTECPKCSIGYRCSGWCMITDMYTPEELDEDPWKQKWIKESLSKYDKGIAKGELISKYLREIKEWEVSK
jgi:hypothetical protein